jgi:hypothetical protein
MTALRIARIALLTSIAAYGVSLLWLTKTPDVFWVCMLSIAGMAISAVVCVVLQIATSVLKRRP